ncbi:hypothetical protein G3480_02925 [Thiorhodococcus mannitoliphagus]|uniref:Uncharacterized protein n=1 Tax=Thiorhodococcus mannitoliphagus TaxID=329406 RepID=A0A6P1DUA0_9GAMM|nr:hypothetical protein [Thiorhodococcus mannitoliphagus]NEX19275.1 hypothetical protein [Thiorhodococcus mannitoliphagus]
MFLIKRDILIVIGVFLTLMLVFLLETSSADPEQESRQKAPQGEQTYPSEPGSGQNKIPAY